MDCLRSLRGEFFLQGQRNSICSDQLADEKIVKDNVAFDAADRLAHPDRFQRCSAIAAAKEAFFFFNLAGLAMQLGLQDGAIGAHFRAVDRIIAQDFFVCDFDRTFALTAFNRTLAQIYTSLRSLYKLKEVKKKSSFASRQKIECGL